MRHHFKYLLLATLLTLGLGFAHANTETGAVNGFFAADLPLAFDYSPIVPNPVEVDEQRALEKRLSWSAAAGDRRLPDYNMMVISGGTSILPTTAQPAFEVGWRAGAV